jgi:hypothetical protein
MNQPIAIFFDLGDTLVVPQFGVNPAVATSPVQPFQEIPNV